MMQGGTSAEGYRAWLAERGGQGGARLSPVRSAADLRERSREIRRSMLRAAGEWPSKCRLEPKVLGTLERDGYRVERLVFQTRSGVHATASAYVPSGKGPFPAVLCVHGHWAGARRDPVVQSRCIGLAKHGFFALTLDAWGAGERGTKAGENEYHGGLLGASLWPVGTPLWGLQLYDNVRALDYLQSRKEVDGERLGCTGASGGGNQTTSLSAFDPRVKCAVPVCSVGRWQDYLRTACCVDEVVPGGLTFAEEGDLLGLAAPGALMVITATKDVYHFGPKSSSEALERTREYFRAVGGEERLRHQLFESGHDYSRPMREAMYGWMARWLKGQGDGSPLPEPELWLEEPAALACYAPGERPTSVKTTAAWVSERWRGALQGSSGRSVQAGGELEQLLALPSLPGPLPAIATVREESFLETEPGLRVPLTWAGEAKRGSVILLHPRGRKAALASPLAVALRGAGLRTVALELRGTGEMTLPDQGGVRGIDDHNLVEWSLWVGRPLLGQWVHDLRTAEAVFRQEGKPLAVVGWREAGLAALCAPSGERAGTAVMEGLASFAEGPVPHQLRMAVFTPGLARLGDLPTLAQRCAAKPVLVANPIRLDGMTASAEEVGRLYGHKPRLEAVAGLTDGACAERISRWFAG